MELSNFPCETSHGIHWLAINSYPWSCTVRPYKYKTTWLKFSRVYQVKCQFAFLYKQHSHLPFTNFSSQTLTAKGKTLKAVSLSLSLSLSPMACSSYALKPISPPINLVNPRSHPTSSPANNTQLSFKLSNPSLSLSQTLKFHSTSPQSPSFSLPKRSFTCKSQADPSDSARPSKYFSHLLTHPPIFTP